MSSQESVASICANSCVCCAPCAMGVTSGCTLLHGHTEALCCLPLGCIPRCRSDLVAVVTGGNRGIGYHTARVLLNQGFTVHILCRNPTLGAEAAEQLQRVTCNPRCESFVVDLGNLDTIHEYIKVADSRELAIATLVNNGGTIAANSVEINHVGHFALTLGLLPALQRGASARLGTSSIVTVSSTAHITGVEMNTVAEKLQNGGEFTEGGWEEYSQSKAANILFSLSLGRRIGHLKISSSAYHPGVLGTDLWKGDMGRNENSSWSLRCFGQYLCCLCVKHPRIAAAGLSGLANPRCLQRTFFPDHHPFVGQGVNGCIKGAWARLFTGSSGGYYQQCLCMCTVPVRPMPKLHDLQLQDKLWEGSLAYINRNNGSLGQHLQDVIKQENVQPSDSQLVSPALPCSEILVCGSQCPCVTMCC